MKIKVTLYGFGDHQFPYGFFERGHDFRRGLDLGLQLTFDTHQVVCDELEATVDRSNLSIPRLYFADFELQTLQVHTPSKLDELAAWFGDLFREYVFAFVDNGSFVGARVTVGRQVAKWSPHSVELK